MFICIMKWKFPFKFEMFCCFYFEIQIQIIIKLLYNQFGKCFPCHRSYSCCFVELNQETHDCMKFMDSSRKETSWQLTISLYFCFPPDLLLVILLVNLFIDKGPCWCRSIALHFHNFLSSHFLLLPRTSDCTFYLLNFFGWWILKNLFHFVGFIITVLFSSPALAFTYSSWEKRRANVVVVYVSFQKKTEKTLCMR